MIPRLRRKRTERERDVYTRKRLWIGHHYVVAQELDQRDESGKILSAIRLALRYDFVGPEYRSKDKVTKNVVAYWKQKALDPVLHPSTHGGHRWDALSAGFEGCREFVYAALWKQINDFPESQLPILTTIANEAITVFAEDRGVDPVEVSQRWVRRVFASWRWSWKVPTVVQLHKFTPQNIERYVNYLVFVAGIPLNRLKFADEIHFVSKGILPRLPLVSSFSLFFFCFLLSTIFIRILHLIQ